MRALILDLARHRELLYSLTVRDIRVRYKQTLMGVAWAFFMPVTLMVLFGAVFTRVAPVDTGGTPYPVFVYVGLVPWSFFSNAVKFSANSLIASISLITKVYFPREVLPLGAIGASLFDAGIASVVLLGLLAWYRVPFHAVALLVLPVFAIQVVLTAAVGLFVAMASLFYRDVKYLIDVALLVMMFGTSVVYPLRRVDGVLGAVLALNPLSVLIDAYRSLLLDGRLPPAAPLAITAAASVVLLMGSWTLFRHAEYRFAERI